MIRLGAVGTGGMTEKFAEACRETGRFRLVSVCSRSRERGEAFAARHGFEGSAISPEALAEEASVDAVYIASPNALHVPQTRLFLEHGKHVLCEKTAVTGSGELRELQQLAKARGLIYAEAVMSRYTQGRAVLKQALTGIGRITLARLDYCQRSSRYDRFMQGEDVNIFSMALAAGTLMDLGIYCVSAAVDLFGAPEEIRAAASFLRGGADGAGCAVFTYPGFPAVLTYGKTGDSAVGSEIIGDAGTVKIRSISQYGGISFVRDGGETLLHPMPARKEILREEACRFADHIERPAELAGEYEQLNRLTAAVHLCMDSIKQKAGILY